MAPAHSPPELPPVTDAHRRSAFAAMRVHGLTYEQAMQHATWPQVIECAAHALRTRIWKAQQPPCPGTRRRHPSRPPARGAQETDLFSEEEFQQ